jgi:hypothetical protein
VAVIALSACSATKQGDPENIKFSGFLGDYSMLKPGGEDQAAFVYFPPGLNLSAYRKVMLDPPQAYLTAEQRTEIGEEDTTYILTALDKAVRESLAEKWDVVEKPGADVLRIRLAISNASSAAGGLTPFTRIIPWGRIISLGVRGVSGDYINQGEVTGEMEALDSATGRRLAAAVDSRVGSNSPLNTFTSWGDVVDAFDTWSERIAERLVELGMKPTK